MSQERLLQAKKLIQQKRYEEARKLLTTIDHPLARDWLDKLDRITPARKSSTLLVLLVGGIGLLLLVVVVFAVVSSLDAQRRRAELEVALLNETLARATENTANTLTVISFHATADTANTLTAISIRATEAAIFFQTATGQAQHEADTATYEADIATKAAQQRATLHAAETATANAQQTVSAIETATSIPLTMTMQVNDIYYTRVLAGARRCPQLECEIRSNIPPGVELAIAAVVPGDPVDGNTSWGLTIYTGREMYVNSSWLMTERPTPTPRR
jgi:hypothetical protein